MVVLLHIFDSPMDARELHSHVFSEPEEGVIRSGGSDRLNRQVTPLRELGCQQPPHQGCINIQFVNMHFNN